MTTNYTGAKRFSTPGYRDPSAAHEQALKIQRRGGKGTRIDRSDGLWVVSYTSYDGALENLSDEPTTARLPKEG